nr:MAG TPA: hypothetical protein [Bacteriophage sp.]
MSCRAIVPGTTQTQKSMTIKGMDGQSYNVTGQGQGNFNTVGKP